ncbi:hypothetical protein VTN49DRAFT_5552 [Thermomyces lanuginosus]|uniref:uncharacterized protein n=2 Tax=Thermomyces TaxID=5540 RepID=UPI0037433321
MNLFAVSKCLQVAPVGTSILYLPAKSGSRQSPSFAPLRSSTPHQHLIIQLPRGTSGPGRESTYTSGIPELEEFSISCLFAQDKKVKMLIKVRTLTGKEIELDIEPDYKVSRIKERVEEKEGIPPVQQRLIFGGKQMADDKTAADYNLEGGATLHLVLALRGGQ